ncbi:MAG: hypothetical protein IPP47_07220 [Bryobacterales bacterium]|nr:hypothetical protein [Bryobacterales bacterium]
MPTERKLASILVAAVALAAPRLDQWRVIGPGGGGAMYYPTVSPHDERMALVRCDMTGSYLTLDGGRNWRMFNLRGPARFYEFDPSDSKVIYTSTTGLWRSADSGRTWNLVLPAPAALSSIDLFGDHGDERMVGRDGSQLTVDALAIDPADSKTLYAAVRNGAQTSLQVSSDWGRSWTKLRDLDSAARKIWIDAKSPPTARTVYVAGKNSVLVRRQGSWSPQAPPDGVTSFADVAGGFQPDGALTIYATSPAGIHVSANGGAHWQAAGLAGKARYSAIATAFFHPQIAYVSFAGLRDETTGPGKAAFGIAKTTDGGRTWTPVWKETDKAGANIADAWVTERFGPGWGENPLSIGVAPRNPELCYTTDYGRTMRTSDGGRTWNAAYSRKVPGGYVSTGLDVTTTYGVHHDPFDKKRLFITYTDIGVFRSEDAGASWISSSQGIPGRWVNTTYWLEFDPAVKGKVWAVASEVHDLPRPKMWRGRGVSKYNGGVVESSDGGRSWQVLSSNLPPGAATHILLDPKSPAKSRTLYITVFGRGVFKSTDGGRTWALKNQGIEGAEPFAWRLTRDANGRLWLIVARRSDDGSAGNPQDGALYRSDDSAEHWTRVPLPAGVNGPNALTVDVRDPQRLYLSLWGRATKPSNQFGGILLSTDSGASWKSVLDQDQLIYDVTADPAHPNVLYACGFSSSAWRSEDRGLTWRRLGGYNFKWGHRVVLDPHDSGRIYVTTFGGSVWHGPAAGDPRAIEDIVTPEAAQANPRGPTAQNR